MECIYFNTCGSCTQPLPYESQLSNKIKHALDMLDVDLVPTIIKSPQTNYRNRAEFRIWHEGDRIDYALNSLNKKEIVKIDECLKVDKKIHSLMPVLLKSIANSNLLKTKLFAVEFLSSLEEVLVTLIYHKKVDDMWLHEARGLALDLGINVVGRSRKVKLITKRDFVKESLCVNGKEYKFEVFEGAFSQPNRVVNEGMIGWVKENLDKTKCDLLELYCGHGNFTIPLSLEFRNVLATEISKTSIKSALRNCHLNGVENVTFLRMSAEDLVSAFKKEREFFRLRHLDLDSFDFSHVFVDPPRAGLDDMSLDFIKNFDNIIYISCSIESLKRDLLKLKKTHKIKKLGFFDQFPYTNHLESGVMLECNDKC